MDDWTTATGDGAICSHEKTPTELICARFVFRRTEIIYVLRITRYAMLHHFERKNVAYLIIFSTAFSAAIFSASRRLVPSPRNA